MNFMDLTMREVDILLKKDVLTFQYKNWKGDVGYIVTGKQIGRAHV